ncbi:hypothetical protein TTHERM_000486878 (macronuclear) [Tetrahymena thermophila SB210]|uniref:Transmembrane protein n=1 Tax=Tetrahymena thermophila (strain SB210) TaxID=312017 RepID=W7XFY3_TETTS|nr:hypothetical protein TTHERM_000486878 [Tetrahymena thermophila SB210]EWS72951.1 hypothetical protein TTHERM_000486878 [Tetrahymena thermophila SB210]|eukprot:XP_012654518.1 hypothetical protein TTHERM_000486878 [Tetrahymena thermophila SB210]
MNQTSSVLIFAQMLLLQKRVAAYLIQKKSMFLNSQLEKKLIHVNQISTQTTIFNTQLTLVKVQLILVISAYESIERLKHQISFCSLLPAVQRLSDVKKLKNQQLTHILLLKNSFSLTQIFSIIKTKHSIQQYNQSINQLIILINYQKFIINSQKISIWYFLFINKSSILLQQRKIRDLEKDFLNKITNQITNFSSYHLAQ